MFFRRRIDFAQQPFSSRAEAHASGTKTANARDFAENKVSAKLPCGGSTMFDLTEFSWVSHDQGTLPDLHGADA